MTVHVPEKTLSTRLGSLAGSRFTAAACAFFFLAGLAFIPLLGIQNDEAYFAVALLPPRAEQYSLHIGPFSLPLMLLSYLGTLKSFLYRPMIRAFGTGIWATRIPMLLVGAAGIWLFYLFFRRAAGERAALVATGLLATDALYLLTICFDWGPVALQHLLLAAALLLLMRFWQDRREAALAGAFFLFGLQLWDKAIAIWILDGMAVAALLVFPRQIFRLLTPPRVAVAALAAILGALPLIVYNLNSGGATLRQTYTPQTSGLDHKALLLWLTANGSGLFGTMTNEDSETPRPHPARGWIERASAAAAAVAGHPRESLLPWAFFLALVLAPLARGPALRAILFALITMAVAWCQMIFTAAAGDSVHHTILLWPFPQMVVGISFAAASRRLGRAAAPALAAALLVVMGSNLAVANEYHAIMVRNGGLRDWTDAIFPLSSYLKAKTPPGVFLADWGIIGSLRLLNRGRLTLAIGDDPIGPRLTPQQRYLIEQMISRPQDLFVNHVKGMEFVEGRNAALLSFARDRGFRPEMVTVIYDSYGRPTFDVYHFVLGR